MRSPVGRVRLLAAGAMVLPALASSGCADLLFKNDHRITIVTPGPNATVGTPVEISWQVRDFVPGRDGSFAVFIDRDPQPPGETIVQLDPNKRNIYTATDTHLHLDLLTPIAASDSYERNHHDLTVVLIGTDGRRIGETAGYVEFNVSGD